MPGHAVAATVALDPSGRLLIDPDGAEEKVWACSSKTSSPDAAWAITCQMK